MSFISVLMALLLEQARPLMRGNLVHASLRAWIRLSAKNLDAGKSLHGWLAWGAAVGVPTVAALGIYWLLDIAIGAPAAVVWSVMMLYTTLGFRQFSFHYTEIRDALTDGDEERARQLLASWRQIDAKDLPRSEIVRHVIEHSVLAAHRHVFGVLAWFSILAAFGFGPAGAVLYRLSEFVARYWQYRNKTHQAPVSGALRDTAAKAWAIIDWLPARLTAISFAVVGSFEEAIDRWRQYQQRGGTDNDGVILAATSGAVNIQLGEPSAGSVTADGEVPLPAGPMPELAHTAVIVGLVWRTVVLWMLLLALLTMARLLG